MKKLLNTADLDAQMAVELPDRDMMALITITLITGDIRILNLRNVDIDVANNICVQLLANESVLDCQATA